MPPACPRNDDGRELRAAADVEAHSCADGGAAPSGPRDRPSSSVAHDDEAPVAPKELHVAPMLHYSTREFRALLRILSRRAVLWTEMVVDETISNASDLDEHLGHDDLHPLVCQVGGNSPHLCGEAASVVLEKYGYGEVNLNVDCPSERVSGKREFGAALMKKAGLARDVIGAMQRAAAESGGNDGNGITASVSVKCRIGVDDLDDHEFAASFIRTLQPVCRRFYLHARKCVLGGLMNARQNRSVPPLNYPRVYDLCRMFPGCDFWINGGIRSLEDAKLIAHGSDEVFDTCGSDCDGDDDGCHVHQVPCHLCDHPNGSCVAPPAQSVAPPNLRGCMMGRAAIDDPCLFHDVDRYFYGDESNPCKNRREVLERYAEWLECVYPRRCCDSDLRPSFAGRPPPDFLRQREYCERCADVYGPERDGLGSIDPLEVATEHVTTHVGTRQKGQAVKPRISSRIMARSLKPVQGVFAGVPKSRAFRRACDGLGADPMVRDCGPGYVLRRAMLAVPPEILDSEF